MSHIQKTADRRATRRVYDREFKLRVVQRIKNGATTTQVARDLGVSPTMVTRWLRESSLDRANAFRGHGQRKSAEARLEQLRRENERLKVEKDFLKKALARFASNPNEHTSSSQSIERCGRLDGCARYSMSRQADITTG